jgi:hypothetical protein
MLQAERFLQGIDADSKPVLLRASDGKSYVTKWRFRKRENRRQINEVIAASVFDYMGIYSPKTEKVHISPGFIKSNRSELQQFFGPLFENLKQGLVFASLVDEESERVANQPPLEQVVNLSHFYLALVADVLLCQGDKRQAIFERAGKKQYRAKFIDNANALESVWWQFKTAPNAVYHDKNVYSLLTAQHIEHAIEKLEAMPASVINDATGSIPAEWFDHGDRAKLDHVRKLLMQRRRNMRFLMQRFLRGDNTEYFPASLLQEFRFTSASHPQESDVKRSF